MPLDPLAKMTIDLVNSLRLPPVEQRTLEQIRQTPLQPQVADVKADVAAIENRLVDGPAGGLPIRIYYPRFAEAALPVLVFFHGGGFVSGSIERSDGIVRTIAAVAGCIAVSVDYRLAPENKFPAATEDCYAAACWVSNHAAEIGADASRIAIGGTSAGGNLAAAVAIMARDRGGPPLTFQLLVFPVMDCECSTPSHRQYARGYFLGRDEMMWYWYQYLGSAADSTNPYASPLRAPDVTCLPPAVVVTAECDPLRDEGEAYGKRLREAGVPVRMRRYAGAIHGQYKLGALLAGDDQPLVFASRALRDAFLATAGNLKAPGVTW